MGERFPASMKIGGAIPYAVADELLDLLLSCGGYFIDSDNHQVDISLESIRQMFEAGLIQIEDPEANWGLFEELENFCINNNIHFDRHSDSHYGYDAENVWFRGDKVLAEFSTNSGDRLITAVEVRKILKKKTSAENRLKLIKDLVMPVEVRPLTELHWVGNK